MYEDSPISNDWYKSSFSLMIFLIPAVAIVDLTLFIMDSTEDRCGGSRGEGLRRGTDADYHNRYLAERSRSWFVSLSLSTLSDSVVSIEMYVIAQQF